MLVPRALRHSIVAETQTAPLVLLLLLLVLPCTCWSFSQRPVSQAASLAAPESLPLKTLKTAVLQGQHVKGMEESGISAFRYPLAENGISIWVFLYQTNLSQTPLGGFFYSQLAEQMGRHMQPEVIGVGTKFDGFSSKHLLAIHRLRSISPNDLVILSDYADVVLNPGTGQPGNSMQRFLETFRNLTENKTGAVVVSAEAQCCVGALSYVRPGDLVSSNGSRLQRACSSGAPNCIGLEDSFHPWEKFMQRLAVERGARAKAKEYAYLNAGLLAGRAHDMAKLLEDMNLEAEEDDQAVMTDMLYASPGRFVLDYEQQLFGNARWPLQDARGGRTGAGRGCVFDLDKESGQYIQTETGTRPLFLHTSGHYYECLRSLAYRIGWAPPPGQRVPRGGADAPCAGVALVLAFLVGSWVAFN